METYVACSLLMNHFFLISLVNDTGKLISDSIATALCVNYTCSLDLLDTDMQSPVSFDFELLEIASYCLTKF